VLHILERVAAVDEREVDRRLAVGAEELVAAHMVVAHPIVHPEAREMTAHLVRLAPLRGSADGLEHPVGQE
jgi:hypothetical protein